MEVWSHQGSVDISESTYNSINRCIENIYFPEGVRYSAYLQGSYKNSTNIPVDSDVDVVIELTSAFKPNMSNLSEVKKELYSTKYPNATYFIDEFKKDVILALQNYYDSNNVIIGNKAVKIKGNSGRLDADVLIAVTYRYFWDVFKDKNDSYTEGIALKTKNGVWIHSYPKQHYENGIKKMNSTNHNYKSLIRIFKNIKLASNFGNNKSFISSYFLESLLYNLPNESFNGSYWDRVYKTLKYLHDCNDADLNNFTCQHELFDLFGSGEGQWSIDIAKKFVSSTIEFWNGWK